MNYRGHIRNGQIMLDDPVELPDGIEVSVELLKQGESTDSVWNKMLELAGTVEGLPSDMAENHDHYSFGTPRRS